MASTSTARLEHELLEKVAQLTLAQKREALDFMTFIAGRRRACSRGTEPSRRTKQASPIETFFDIVPGKAIGTCPLDAIVDLAADCSDTDLSVNHDKYLYGDNPL